MDRDKRWERTKIAFDALTRRIGQECQSDQLNALIDEKYENEETDEFFKPLILIGSESSIESGDTVIFFNYRSDRMRQICQLFQESPNIKSIPEVAVLNEVCVFTMTRYSSDFTFPVLSPPQVMSDVLAEWLAKQGKRQCHIAETEKYAHVTFFFNGGREDQFEGEERVLIPSPKVATYDLKPEMSCNEVADAVIDAMKQKEEEEEGQGLKGKFALVMCNLAPPDMVGHTGKYEETIKAVEATDAAIGRIFETCQQEGYTLFITSDHGNAEKMKCSEGRPHTAHTCAQVPFICSDKQVIFGLEEKVAALEDVAPTLLAYMNISKPEAMTGHSLIK